MASILNMIPSQMLKLGRSAVNITRTFTSASSKPYNVPDTPWGKNRAARIELAAAYRGLDELGLNEGVCNHLSVWAPRADGRGHAMLVFPFGLHWSEVTASNLVALDADGVTVEGEGSPELTAACIHLGIRRVCPNATVIMHTHQPYATTLACLEDQKLKMIHQNCTRFYERISHDRCYSGLAHAIQEGERLGKVLGKKDILFMGNHGILAVADTISLAFDHLYYLERAAQLQVQAESTGRPLSIIPDNEAKTTELEFWKGIQHYADVHFYSMFKRLRNKQPDFEH